MTDGSEAQKVLFCRTFIDTHRSFEPTELPWPQLDADSIDRLRAIPFWTVALAAEVNAGRMVSRFAETLDDPLLRDAMRLQGFEESRHAKLLETMLRQYDISYRPPQVPERFDFSERALVDFGYEECIDSFFGFGIFGLARAVQLFVPALTDIFETVLVEEARHVTFFVNWNAYRRASRGRNGVVPEAILTGYGYLRAVRRIVATFAPGAKNGAKIQGTGFGAEGAFAVFDGMTWRTFLQSCVDENTRYLGGMHPDLHVPRVLPVLAQAALSLPSRRGRQRTATTTSPS